MSDLPIIIIGAAISGLALAHNLKSLNIPCQVFVSEEGVNAISNTRRSITVHAAFFEELLPKDLWRAFKDISHEYIPKRGRRQIDALTGLPITIGAPAYLREENTLHRVDLQLLWYTLLTPLIKSGLADTGKTFIKYEEVEDCVTAWFTDGTLVKGRLLLGNDGPESLVRRQLVPDLDLLDTGGRIISGRSLSQGMSRATLDMVRSRGCAFSDTRIAESPVRMYCDFLPSIIMSKGDSVKPPGTTIPDTVYWRLHVNRDKLGSASSETAKIVALVTSLDYAVLLTKGWHTNCHEILKQSQAKSININEVTTVYPDFDAWETNGRVILMGEAAHPEARVGDYPIHCGQDALLLLKAILDGGSLEDLNKYNDEMRYEGRKHVADCLAHATRLFGLGKVDKMKPSRLNRK